MIKNLAFLAYLFLFAFIFITNSVFACPYDTWWNTEWKYAKIINITENSGKDLADYQVAVNISYNDSMRLDFDDLRFTYCNDSTGEEEAIPYWIEEKIDGNYSKIWVRVPFIPANGNSIVKMYYGNENAESESNGSKVFVIFDDFENLDQWVIYQNYGGSEISITTNYKKTGNTSVKLFGSATGNAYLGRTDIPFDSYIYEIYVFDLKENLPERQVQSFETDGEVYPGQCKYVDVGYFENYSPTNYTVRFSEVCNGTLIVTNVTSTYGWHLFGIYWNGTNYFVYIDNQFVAKSPDGWIGGKLHPLGSYFGDRWRTEKSTFYWDTYKIRKFTDPEPTYSICDLETPQPPQPKPPIPTPTDRSIIISTPDFRNIISGVPSRLPLLVTYTGSLTNEIQKFISEYQPDYIYTLGFSAGLENSYEIEYNEIPDLFFPNATQAIFVQNRTKAILASALAYYLHIPVIFEPSSNYEVLDLESMTADEIQNLYVEKLKENGDNTNYLVLSNFNSEESVIAGYLAGLRKGFIIPLYNSSSEHAFEKIKDAISYLENKKLFSASLAYKKGEPLYLAILGNGSSINFWRIPDYYSEIFNDKDGKYIYSDIGYSDVNRDGKFDLALGRLDGNLQAITLHFARQKLTKNNKALLIGEYRHAKFEDALFSFGGMSQAFIIDKAVLTNTENKRVVEKRLEEPLISEEIKKLLEKTEEESNKGMIGSLLKIFSNIDRGINLFYSLFEFSWDTWLANPLEDPEHLPVINETLNDYTKDMDLVAYFGSGDKYWLIPKENRTWQELYFDPYGNHTNLTYLEFSNFLYDDHDISAEGEIKKYVQKQGGCVLASSGIIHDPFTIISSSIFFSSLNEGKSLGTSYLDILNLNPYQRIVSFALFPSFYMTRANMYLGIKDVVERVLFADPAYEPFDIEKQKISMESCGVSPSGSFTLFSSFETNYALENDSVLFFNANSYLLEQERPVIPLFVKTFILPEDSILKNVDVKNEYTFVRELEKHFVYNDSYYSNYTKILEECLQELGLEADENVIGECVKNKLEPQLNYPYPNESYWYTVQTLLDGRKEVYVYIPAIIYEKGFAKILEKSEISIEYDTQADLNIKTENIPLGANENIEITFFNQGNELQGEFYIWIEGENEKWNFSESVMLEKNTSKILTFSLKPENKDVFYVKALFVSDSLTIGPRVSYFKVDEINFSLSKKFKPDEIKTNRTSHTFSEINIKNIGDIEINSIEIIDSIPYGFSIPSVNPDKKIGIEDDDLELNGRSIIIFILEKDGKCKKHKVCEWYKKKVLDKKYYNVSFLDGKLLIKTSQLNESNLGKNLKEGDMFVVKYLMIGKSNEDMTTETKVKAIYEDTFAEKMTQTELHIK